MTLYTNPAPESESRVKSASGGIDELRAEYDMDELLKDAVRGKYAARQPGGSMGDDKPVVFVVRNGHVAKSGQPPRVEATPGQYTSYFENQYGEQWIFVRRESADTATLYGGDIGWEQPKTVSGLPEKRDNYWTAAGLVLNMPEALWLMACWAASQPLGE